MLRHVLDGGSTTCRVALLLALLCWAAPARAQDFERPGFYLGGGGLWFGEQFGSDLDSEVEEALGVADAELSVSDSHGGAAILGVRMGSRFALELVGEKYDDIDFELDTGGVETDGELEAWSALLMGKVFLTTGRIQPYLTAGVGYVQGKFESGDLDETGHAGVARAGLGLDLYLSPHWVLGVQGAYSRGLSSDFEDLAYITAGGSLTFRF